MLEIKNLFRIIKIYKRKKNNYKNNRKKFNS